jgi:hypothetical protein
VDAFLAPTSRLFVASDDETAQAFGWHMRHCCINGIEQPTS